MQRENWTVVHHIAKGIVAEESKGIVVTQTGAKDINQTVSFTDTETTETFRITP